MKEGIVPVSSDRPSAMCDSALLLPSRGLSQRGKPSCGGAPGALEFFEHFYRANNIYN